MKPGFHPRILECIKDRASSFSDKELLVAVAFDEMSIKTSLIFDQRLDSVVGYEDIGDGVRSDKVASYATVFMVRGIFGTWKQPVGYFLTSGTMSAEISKQKLEQCLSHVRRCGLIPKVVICDQGPSNRGCCSLLNVNDDGYFISEGKIYIFINIKYIYIYIYIYMLLYEYITLI